MGLDITGFGAVADLVGKVVDRVFPDKTEETLAQIGLLKEQLTGAISVRLAELQISIEQAKSASIWVAGARPAITWVCACALFYQFLLRPLLPWMMAVTGHPVLPMPSLDENLWELTATTIGMSGWRSFDKKNGRA